MSDAGSGSNPDKRAFSVCRLHVSDVPSADISRQPEHPCPIHKRQLYRLAWPRGLIVPNARRAWRCSYYLRMFRIRALTLRCTDGGLIHDAQVSADPMKSDAAGAS